MNEIKKPHQPIRRPYWYTIVLWIIPIVTWILLLSLFIDEPEDQQDGLVTLETPAEMDKVIQYLDSQNIQYEPVDEMTIRITLSPEQSIYSPIHDRESLKDKVESLDLNTKSKARNSKS